MITQNYFLFKKKKLDLLAKFVTKTPQAFCEATHQTTLLLYGETTFSPATTVL